MEFSIKKAFKVPFSEEGWFFKSMNLGLVFLVAILLEMKFVHLYRILWIPCIISACIYFGYGLQFIHNEVNSKTPLLPKWQGNIVKYFTFGFKYFVTAILSILLIDFISHLLLRIAGLPLNTGRDVTSPATIPLSFINASIILLIQGFLLCIYADRFKLLDVFFPVKYIKLFWAAKKEILLSVMLALVLFISQLVIGMIMLITIIGIPFLPLFIGVIPLVVFNITAQAYKVGKYRLNKTISELPAN